MDKLTARQLKVGIFLPAFEYMMDGQTARWADILVHNQATFSGIDR